MESRMIKTESGTDLYFRTYGHTRQCDAIVDLDKLIFFTNVAQTKHLYFKAFSQSFCEYESREIFLQETNVHMTTFDQTANGWIEYIKEAFYGFPQVQSIYYTIDDADIDIWLIIPLRDFQLLRKLVDMEMRILDIFSSTDSSLYRFEFHILYRNNANENQIVPKRALHLPK